MRFLHLIRPVMCVLPEVASPDRKVSSMHRLYWRKWILRVEINLLILLIVHHYFVWSAVKWNQIKSS